MATRETKAQQAEKFEARLQQLEEELKAQQALTDQYRRELEAGRDDEDDELFDESAATMLYDPFDAKNPFKIIGHIEPDDEYPEGAVVGWKSPAYRERRQWRGWHPFTYGDKYTGKDGELLSKYVPDPPRRMENEKLDNYIRRGDVILARLDKRIWESRQAKRILDSQKNEGKAGSRARTVLGEGVEVVGRGVSKSHRPTGGFRPEQESTPMPEGGHRRVHPTTRPQES